MLEGLFPSNVVTEHILADADPGSLFPEEESSAARMAPKRRAEFARGRECARRALARLGLPRCPVAVGAEREPIWPAGVAGSISHTRGLCAAAVARCENHAGIGLDVERAEPLKPEVAARVCEPEEMRALRGTTDFDDLTVARLIFSAKEAGYKCQFPITRSFLPLRAATIALHPEGTFEVHWLQVPAAFPSQRIRIRGRWRRCDEFLLTAAWLDPEA